MASFSLHFLTRLANNRSALCKTAAKQLKRNDSIFTKYREPPNGFLFNRKPLKPGEKREREHWELIWYFGWGSCLLLAIVGGYFRPNEGVFDWARKEAEIRVAEIDAAEQNS